MNAESTKSRNLWKQFNFYWTFVKNIICEEFREGVRKALKRWFWEKDDARTLASLPFFPRSYMALLSLRQQWEQLVQQYSGQRENRWLFGRGLNRLDWKKSRTLGTEGSEGRMSGKEEGSGRFLVSSAHCACWCCRRDDEDEMQNENYWRNSYNSP